MTTTVIAALSGFIIVFVVFVIIDRHFAASSDYNAGYDEAHYLLRMGLDVTPPNSKVSKAYKEGFIDAIEEYQGD